MLDFLIMYEVKVRELESIIVLGNELKKRGYSVDYISFEEVDHNKYIKNRKLIKKYFNNVRVCLTPSLYHDKELFDIVYYVCGQCEYVINLRWEQYFSNSAMNNPDIYLFPHGDAQKANYLCWGQYSYDSLIAAGVDKSNLFLTGALQLDFVRKEFSGYYMSRGEIYEKYQIPEKSKTVLYMSSFTRATMTERQIIKEKNDFKEENYKVDESVFDFGRQSYEITLSWIEEFLKKNKDVVFIYRPHPAENITDKIKTLVDKYDNFKIITDYSVKQWISVCDTIVTWVSTSIVEAYFANKPCFIVRPLPYRWEDDMSVYKDATFLTTKEEFLNILNMQCKMSVSEEVMRYAYSVDDKLPSFIRLSDELEHIISEKKTFPWDKNKVEEFEKKRPKLITRAAIYEVYIILIKLLVCIKGNRKISFGNYFDARIENYNISCQKLEYNRLNEDSFGSIEEKVNNFLAKLREKS